MTTLAERKVTCGVCGAETTVIRIGSTNTMEGPDLDTRPGQMMRSTILCWVECCRECGYAAPVLDQAPEGTAAVVRSEGYQDLRRQSGLPDRARSFFLHAHLLGALGHLAEAGWTELHAAWVCDDCGDGVSAAAARLRAIGSWKKAKANGVSFMEDEPSEFALVTDVLRRAGRFEEARETCKTALDGGGLPPLIEGILRFELALIDKRDAGCHKVEEVKAPPPGAARVSFD
jgi:hypothetical protein